MSMMRVNEEPNFDRCTHAGPFNLISHFEGIKDNAKSTSVEFADLICLYLEHLSLVDLLRSHWTRNVSLFRVSH